MYFYSFSCSYDSWPAVPVLYRVLALCYGIDVLFIYLYLVFLAELVHGIAYLAFPWGVDRYRTGVDAIQENRTKPVLFSILGARKEMEEFRVFMDDSMIPSYYSPEMAIKVLSNMRRYARIREIAAGPRI